MKAAHNVHKQVCTIEIVVRAHLRRYSVQLYDKINRMFNVEQERHVASKMTCLH